MTNSFEDLNELPELIRMQLEHGLKAAGRVLDHLNGSGHQLHDICRQTTEDAVINGKPTLPALADTLARVARESLEMDSSQPESLVMLLASQCASLAVAQLQLLVLEERLEEAEEW